MAIQANIAPNIRSVQTGNFTFTITFSAPMGSDVAADSFTLANIQITGSSDITSAHLMLAGFEANVATIGVTLPSEVSGSFEVSLIGSVMVGSQSESITSTGKIITYDSRSRISAGFGDPVHHGPPNFEISLSITFPEDVARFTRTDCELERIAGDQPYGMETYLTGIDREFELTLIPELGTVGVVEVNLSGAATRGVTERVLDVSVTPVLVPFNARVPEIVEIEAPPLVKAGTYDILWTLDHPDVGFDTDDLIYEGEITGVDFDADPPSIYRARALDVQPEMPLDPIDPADPPDCYADWVRTRPGVNPIATRFLLLRFNMPPGASGQFSVHPKSDAFRPATP